MSSGNTQAVEKQSPVNEAQDSRTISIVSVNVDRLTSYKLRSIEEYTLTADTNFLAMQEVGSKGAEYLERASFSRLNWFTTDISKNKDIEENKINILATYFNSNMDKEAEKVFDEDRILGVKTKLNPKSYYIINIYAPHAGKTAKEYSQFLTRLQKAISLKRKKDLMIILGDWNAQIRHNEVISNGNYGYTTRTNRNGKILRDFLNKYNLAIVNSYFATGAKNTNSHVTYYSKHKNNQKRSEIDFIIACKGSTPLFRKIRIKRKLGEKIHNRTEFDHQPVEALVSQKFRKYSNQNPKMHRNYKEFFKIDANRWKLNEEIRQGFEEEIAKLPPSNNSGKQPRLNFQTFKSTVKQAIENCIPLVAHE
eukprot:snap_masked-scaffold_1-processed-gene-10.17-mRNA-1 protein AED:1.00 eAED:1.00 QI:0/-1/0/0/-1/1/1/0/364